MTIQNVIDNSLKIHPEFEKITGPYKSSGYIPSIRFYKKDGLKKLKNKNGEVIFKPKYKVTTISVVRLAFEIHHNVCLINGGKVTLEKELKRKFFNNGYDPKFEFNPDELKSHIVYQNSTDKYTICVNFIKKHIFKIYPNYTKIRGPYLHSNKNPYIVLTGNKYIRPKSITLSLAYYEIYHSLCFIIKTVIDFKDKNPLNLSKDNLIVRNELNNIYLTAKLHMGDRDISKVIKIIKENHPNVYKITGPYKRGEL